MSQSVETGGGGAASGLAGRGRLLIILDEMIGARSLEGTLKAEGYEPTTARTIEDARRCIAGGDFEAVLIDWEAFDPDAAGHDRLVARGGTASPDRDAKADLIGELRAAPRPCSAVLISGQPRAIAAREACVIGAEAHLQKPLESSEHFRVIDKAVERTRAWRRDVEAPEARIELEGPKLSVVPRPSRAKASPARTVGAGRKRYLPPRGREPTKLLPWPPLRTLGAVDIEWCADEIAQIGGLTDRERRILVPLLRGEQNDQIADGTGASKRTVKFHVSNILKKLRISQRSELVRFIF